MVYTFIEIIYGTVVSRQDLLKYFYPFLTGESIEDITNDVHEECIEFNRDVFSHGVEIFNYPCCSELNDKQWIVGIVMRKYHRQYQDCESSEKCNGYNHSSECLGMTENGFYDVDKILNNVVHIPEGQICYNCYNDNKEIVSQCKSCKYTICKSSGIDWVVMSGLKKCKMSKELLIEFGKLPKNFIYRVDDCLNCS